LRLLITIPLAFLLTIFPMMKNSCSTEPEWPAGCPHGEVVLTNITDPDSPGAYFDFSQGKLLFGEEGKAQGDIYLEKTFICGNPSLHVKLHDDLADSFLFKTSAPTLDWIEQPSEEIPSRLSIYDGHNVWVRTGEGYLGKIKFIGTESNTDVSSFNFVRLMWIYQPDGSDEFHPVAGAAGTDTTQPK
jgi:hypothetical protein